MYVTASLCILFSSANNFLISSVIFVISNSPFHFYYVVAFYTFSRDFHVLGRDFRQAGLGFSTFSRQKQLFKQRFLAGGNWFLYPFRRFSLFWVEISGRWGLVSLPFSGKNHCLGRNSRHHTPPRHTTTSHPTTAHPTTSRPTTARPTTAHSTTAQPATASRTATVTHHVAVSLSISLLLLYFIREIIDFNEHQPRIKRG